MTETSVKAKNLVRLENFKRDILSQETLDYLNTFHTTGFRKEGQGYTEKVYAVDILSLLSVLEVFGTMDDFSIADFDDREVFTMGVFLRKYYNIFQQENYSDYKLSQQILKTKHKVTKQERLWNNEKAQSRNELLRSVVKTLGDIDSDTEKREEFFYLVKTTIENKSAILMPDVSGETEHHYTNDHDILQNYVNTLKFFMETYLHSSFSIDKKAIGDITLTLQVFGFNSDNNQDRYEYLSDSVMRNFSALHKYAPQGMSANVSTLRTPLIASL